MASSVIVVLSNPSVSLSPRSKILFFLLLEWTDELLPTSKIKTCLPNAPFGNEKRERTLNSIP